MKAIVTGGAGFIGRHLVDLLINKGCKVLIIDNLANGKRENCHPGAEFCQEDIRNRKMGSLFRGADVVFHLAGLTDMVASIHDPETYYDVNVTGTLNVLEASRRHNVKRFIYAASASCYGISTELPTSEKALIAPEFPYALTKKLGEDLVLHYEKVYRLPAVTLRLFNVFGPKPALNNSYGSVFSIFLRQKRNNEPLTVVGDGSQTRDFVYVTDVAAAFYKASMSSVSGEIFNVGSGKEHSILELAKMFGDECKFIPKREGEAERSLANISKIREKLYWEPEIDFASGVHKLMASQ